MRVFLKADRVREWLARKSRGPSWLAFQLDITSGYMSQLLSGTRCPSPGLRQRMLRQFGGGFDDWFEIQSN